jgi:hypothetical protein
MEKTECDQMPWLALLLPIFLASPSITILLGADMLATCRNCAIASQASTSPMVTKDRRILTQASDDDVLGLEWSKGYGSMLCCFCLSLRMSLVLYFDAIIPTVAKVDPP